MIYKYWRVRCIICKKKTDYRVQHGLKWLGWCQKHVPKVVCELFGVEK